MTRARLLALVVGMVASGALGQDAPLKGPAIKEERPAGLGSQFAEGKTDRKGPMNERVPMRIYAQAIDKLRGEGAPEGLRLTPQQDEQVQKIEKDFRESMQEFARRRNRNADGQSQEPMTEEARRARMQELLRNGQNPADAQVRVYAILTADQRKFVEAEVAKAQSELEKRRTEEYAQRLLKKRQGDAAKPTDTPGAKPTDKPTDKPAAADQAPERPLAPEGRERARRLIERLQQLPPEERDQIMRRIEEELDRRAANPGRARGGDRKPAPSIDDVKVPQPDKP